jgi:hypothetical protein
MSDEKLIWRFSTLQCIKFGICVQILGALLLTVTFFNQTPWLMIMCFGGGAGLLALGLLLWVIMFFKKL